jgi:hypothetical protein
VITSLRPKPRQHQHQEYLKKGIVLREPAAQQKKIISTSSTDKGKGKQVENPRIMYKWIDFTEVPFQSWPKELQVEHDSIAALKAQELIVVVMIELVMVYVLKMIQMELL